MKYEEFRYLFPPRPEIKSPVSGIPVYEKMGMWAQPKLNGSCALVFTDGNEAKMMNRHYETFSRELIKREELLELHRGKGWLVLVGELMNKSQRGEDGKIFNSKFVIFDILVYNGEYLVGSTFEERQNLIDQLFSPEPYQEWVKRINDIFYRVENITSNMLDSWKKLVSVEMYEGLVFKKPSAKLDVGYKPANNTGWQVKVRKPTKNYSY